MQSWRTKSWPPARPNGTQTGWASRLGDIGDMGSGSLGTSLKSMRHVTYSKPNNIKRHTLEIQLPVTCHAILPDCCQALRLFLVWDSEGISEKEDSIIEDLFSAADKDESDSECSRTKRKKSSKSKKSKKSKKPSSESSPSSDEGSDDESNDSGASGEASSELMCIHLFWGVTCAHTLIEALAACIMYFAHSLSPFFLL